MSCYIMNNGIGLKFNFAAYCHPHFAWILFYALILCSLTLPHYILYVSIHSYQRSSSVIIVGCLCTIISVVLSYLRPCKSLCMNVSLSFHLTLIGIAGIMIALWEQDSFISTETLAVAFAVLMAIPHILMVIWVAYNILSHMRTKYQFYPERRVLKCLARLHCRQHELDCLLPKERDNSQQLSAP